ncbi:hypothetical protein VSH64_41315 [Amycolatopsis rhabdoformis]|uniref:Uncharacterized protein n=1 Tax=Amycolatopsis rhabdoformis TaxID=1448059 RepID=A0ABZ1I472_9PSEU|nr:hypothetical protein [Amycolatopsis rhabdoformis]WSE29187.1 hypothetical protein VSH64_41315 [Amycolatopsis rhabdoformis]
MNDFEALADGGPTYCLMDGDDLVKRLTVDARPWFGRGSGDNEASVVVTATVVLGDDADLMSPTGNLFMIL